MKASPVRVSGVRAGRPACIAAAALVCVAVPAASVEAFPGAAGHGREAAGGRGGRIIEVVNLEDSGPGSLRACVLETGPRNCVFRLAGVITLRRTLLVDGAASGRLPILGQTAPGEGITLTVAADSTDFMRTVMALRNTQDVVVRHLRLRSQAPRDVVNIDALTVEESRRVYIDHVSGAWASDENFNAQGQATDITVAYSIFAEGLRPHSKCALLGSHAAAPQNISFWRNLCVSNNDRNPDDNHFARSCIEIVDNLFYNARSEWAEIFTQKPGGTTISIVGNTFKGGPSTLTDTAAINWNDIDSVAPPRIHAEANAVWSPPGKTVALYADDTAPFVVATPACPMRVPTFRDPAASYREVLARAGAFPRDGADRRFLREVGPQGQAGGGAMRLQAGRIDPVAPAEPYADGDHDGMADGLETRFGAAVGVADAFARVDDEGWTSFDRFMQWLSEERLAGRYPG